MDHGKETHNPVGKVEVMPYSKWHNMSHPPPNPVPTKPPIGLYGGNLLVAAPSSWDEACFSAPAVRAIRKARPLSVLGVVCPEEQVEYWKSAGKINQVIGYGAGRSYREMLREQKYSKITWESAILWEGNAGAQLAYDLKVRQRFGYAARDLKKWLTEEVVIAPVHGAPEHRVQHYLRYMDRLKIPVNHPQLFKPVTLVGGENKRGILISPESDYGAAYEWGEENWRAVLQLIQEKIDAPVRVVSHPGSKTALAERIARDLPDMQFTKLASVGSSLSFVGSHALAICADSSLCHIAAHVGATVITLFGPGDPHWRRPLGRQHVVIRHKVECNACLLAKCPLDMRCQNELTVARVSAALLQKYQELGL